MYKQRPAYPALIGAAVVLVFGFMATFNLYDLSVSGELGIEVPVMAGALSIGVSGAFLILAFARYQFTHLWKKSSFAPARKSRDKRSREKKSNHRAT